MPDPSEDCSAEPLDAGPLDAVAPPPSEDCCAEPLDAGPLDAGSLDAEPLGLASLPSSSPSCTPHVVQGFHEHMPHWLNSVYMYGTLRGSRSCTNSAFE